VTTLPTDEDLLARAASGDRRAFSALVDRAVPAVWAVARRLSPDDATAEDVLQETFVAAWKGAPRWRAEGSARAWLLGLARRQAARSWRRRVGEPREHDSLADLALAAGWGSDPEVLVARAEDRATLLRALADLGELDRQVLVRCDLEGVEPTELAVELGVPAGTIRVRRHRARLRLLARLNAEVTDG
jgi:RNA polymerase sigma factor (sigma-70 family)